MTNLKKTSQFPFQTPYNTIPHPPLMFDEPSLTKQASQDECDINILMAKYEKDQILDHLNEHQGSYGDFIAVPEYHDALNQIHAANDAFNSLPASIRSKFNNDPALFLDFAQDDRNHDQMVKMGLVKALPATPLEAAIEKANATPAKASNEASMASKGDLKDPETQAD